MIPFFESGIPVEYELVRSINTVAQPKRAKLGIVNTDANFMGGFSMAGGGFQQIPKQPIVEELEKQYEVESVDPNSPISTDQFDVLFVVQPSSLNPQQLINLVDAVKAGVPTAIFEDPFPFAYQGIPGTGEPKQAQNNPMFGGAVLRSPKVICRRDGNPGFDIPIQSSFSGINRRRVACYNPHPKLEYMANATSEWLFILEGSGENEGDLSTASQVTDGLRELMFVRRAVRPEEEKRDDLKITELVKTRENSGRIGFSDLQTQMGGGNVSATQLQVLEGPPTGHQTIAVYVEGVSQQKATESKEGAGEKTAEKETTKEKEAAENTAEESRPIKAVYVADVDFVHPFFSENRKNPEQFRNLICECRILLLC